MAERGRYAKGEQRRLEILDAALELFGQQGYQGTTLRDIARRIGISLPGLTHYFPTKADLFAAVLYRRDERDSLRADTMEDFFELVRSNADVPGLVELYATMAAAAVLPGHPARDWYASHLERTVGKLIDEMAGYRRDGILRPEIDPEHAARSMVALADGLQQQWLVDRSVDMVGILRAYWAGLCSDPE